MKKSKMTSVLITLTIIAFLMLFLEACIFNTYPAFNVLSEKMMFLFSLNLINIVLTSLLLYITLLIILKEFDIILKIKEKLFS